MASQLDAGSPSPPSPHSPTAGHDRVPPSNLDAEASVLGSMLLSRDAIAEVAEHIGAEDFYRGAHRTIFEAARDLYDRGEPVDEVLLGVELERRGTLGDVGGHLGLHELANRVPTAANAAYYARVVGDAALRRRLIDAGTLIARMGYDPERGADEAVDAAEALIYKVAQRQRGGDFPAMRELLNTALQLLEKLHAAKSSITGLATGFTDFDELTAGLQPANLVIIAARPSVGKSTLITNIATHVAAEQRKPVVFFSLEMSQTEVVQRILSAEARIDSTRLRTGRLTDPDWERVARAMGRLGEAPLYLDDTPGITVMEMRSKCRRLAQQKGLSMIVVDYLQLMESPRTSENRVQQVSEFSRGLKLLAKELDVPVVALSQLSRKPEERTDKRPMLSDLRDSGSIEQDADLVCFIYREDLRGEKADSGDTELIVAKHRNGPLRTIHLSFLGHHTRFASMARGVGPAAGGPHLRAVPPPVAPPADAF